MILHGNLASLNLTDNIGEVWKGMASIRHGLPITRMGTPADIAAMVAFLISDDAGYINGQTFGVNGGLLFR